MAKRNLSNLSTDELTAELKRRQRRLPALERKRQKLLAQLAEVEAEIGKVPSSSQGSRGGGRRPKNDMTLPEAIAKVMSTSKPMSIGDIMKAVQTKAGYRSNSSNFRGVISQTLGKDKQFKKKGRGMYLLAKK